MLPDYRPDDSVLLLFRRLGRLGTVISILYLVLVSYEVYITNSYLGIINRAGKYRVPVHLINDYRVRFWTLCVLCVLGMVSLILLFRSSRSLLQYGSEPDNINMNRPVKYLYHWFICLAVGTLLNALYYSYLVFVTGDF